MAGRISEKQARKLLGGKAGHKYSAKPEARCLTCGGYVPLEPAQAKAVTSSCERNCNVLRFASGKEARRFDYLFSRSRFDVTKLECQPRFRVVVAGVHVCDYIADFRYVVGGATVVEDVKSAGTRTPVYRLKKKLVEALHGIVITEVD